MQLTPERGQAKTRAPDPGATACGAPAPIPARPPGALTALRARVGGRCFRQAVLPDRTVPDQGRGR